MIVAPDSSRQFQTRLHELLAPELLARQVHPPEHALDHVLRRDAGVVGAADPERVAALHAPQADDHVLHRAVERVPHVQGAGDVGRRHGDHERLAGVVRLGGERARRLPAREHRRLDGGGVVARLGLEACAGGGVHAPRILGPGPQPLRRGCGAARRPARGTARAGGRRRRRPRSAAGGRRGRARAGCAARRRASRGARGNAAAPPVRRSRSPLTSQAGSSSGSTSPEIGGRSAAR